MGENNNNVFIFHRVQCIQCSSSGILVDDCFIEVFQISDSSSDSNSGDNQGSDADDENEEFEGDTDDSESDTDDGDDADFDDIYFELSEDASNL